MKTDSLRTARLKLDMLEAMWFATQTKANEFRLPLGNKRV